jgi:hypothetical protein
MGETLLQLETSHRTPRTTSCFEPDDDFFDSFFESSRTSIPSEKNSNSIQSGYQSSYDNNENTREAIKEMLSKKNTWKVKLSRGFFIGVLIMTAAATSVVVYTVCQRSEQIEFAAQYDNAASKIVEAFEHVVSRAGTMNSIGIQATTEGLRDPHTTTNLSATSTSKMSNWPFVIIPNFQQRTQTVRLLSEVLYLAIHPLISDVNRDSWEKYVVDYPAKSWMYVIMH